MSLAGRIARLERAAAAERPRPAATPLIVRQVWTRITDQELGVIVGFYDDGPWSEDLERLDELMSTRAPELVQAIEPMLLAVDALERADVPLTDPRWRQPLPPPSTAAIREAHDVLATPLPSDSLEAIAHRLLTIDARVVMAVAR